MTLIDMVNYVCGKVSQKEPDDQAACRLFLQVRHDNAWADQLWKDSIYSYTQVVSASGYTPGATWLPTKQILLCDTEFEHILAVRTALRRLDVETPETFYRSNFDIFSSTGDARQFMDLPRAVFEFDVAQNLYLQNSGAAATTVVVDTVGSDLTTKERVKLGIPPGVTFLRNGVNRIDGFSKPVGDGPVSIGLGVPFFTVIFQTTGSFTTCGVAVNSTNPAAAIATLTSGGSTVVSVNLGDTISFFFGSPGLAYYGTGYTVVNTSGVLTVSDVVNGVGNPGVGTFVAGQPLVTPIITIAATDTNAPLRCRIQPIGTLPDPTTLRLLGKAKLGTFVEDNDAPLIAGMDKVLIEMALGDMWERERQFGFAQQPFQRGATLLEQLKRVQTVQTAYNKRLIPSGGYADEYQLNTGILTVFP